MGQRSELEDDNPKGKRRRLGIEPQQDSSSKTVAPDLLQATYDQWDIQVKNALYHCYGSADFKSGEQKQLLWACLQRKPILAVLPTGSGKSIAYEIPPYVVKQTTVAIIPFKQILKQVHQRAAKHTSVVEWTSKTSPLVAKQAKLLLVSAESAVAAKFQEYVILFTYQIHSLTSI